MIQILFFFLPFVVTKLTWADFRGKPDPNDAALAVTQSYLSLTTKTVDGKCYFTIDAGMNRDSSWTKTTKLDVLNHEQGHYDITMFYGKKIRAEFKKYQGCPARKWFEAETLFDELSNEHDALQKQYDAAAGRVGSEHQSQWDDIIRHLQ